MLLKRISIPQQSQTPPPLPLSQRNAFPTVFSKHSINAIKIGWKVFSPCPLPNLDVFIFFHSACITMEPGAVSNYISASRLSAKRNRVIKLFAKNSAFYVCNLFWLIFYYFFFLLFLLFFWIADVNLLQYPFESIVFIV